MMLLVNGSRTTYHYRSGGSGIIDLPKTNWPAEGVGSHHCARSGITCVGRISSCQKSPRLMSVVGKVVNARELKSRTRVRS